MLLLLLLPVLLLLLLGRRAEKVVVGALDLRPVRRGAERARGRVAARPRRDHGRRRWRLLLLLLFVSPERELARARGGVADEGLMVSLD